VSKAELSQFLIEHGALVNATDDLGHTALHWAIMIGQMKTVCLLLEHGSDNSHRTCKGDDALQCAAVYSPADIVQYLVKLECGPMPVVTECES